MDSMNIFNRLSESVKEDWKFITSISIQSWQERLEWLLNETSNPERVIVGFAQFLRSLDEPIEPHIQKYLHTPKYLRFFERIFSQSPFLTDTLIKYPQFADEILSSSHLSRSLTKQEWLQFLGWNISTFNTPSDISNYLRDRGLVNGSDWDLKKIMLHLRRLHKKALLRIVTRDIVEHCDVKSIAEDLSNLADAHLELCFHLLFTHLQQRYGTP
ncbi:MAG: hypothetical protein N3E40_08190, partial [Dehalococcoidia bacterium]|nr:hypothetical protein [Dehalococcoidia bacterium]